MVALDKILAEVLSMLVDGTVIRSAYFIRNSSVVALWPPNSLDNEVVELSRQVHPIGRYDIVLVFYSRHLSSIYVALTLGYAILLIRLNKDIMNDCTKLLKVLRALSSFSEKVNLIIASN